MKGRNRADPTEYLMHVFDNFLAKSENKESNKPCVFISHKKEDTDACEEVAQYLLNASVDIYFDKNDKTLSQLVEEGNADKITEHLKKGIDRSTHMLCVVSKKTVESYWVPFEVGYGFHHTTLGVLTLKDVCDEELPEYMKITRVVRGTQSLNKFISELLSEDENLLEQKDLLIKSLANPHPLDRVLQWNR